MMSINSAQCRAEPVAVEGQQSTKVPRLYIPEFDQFCRSVNSFFQDMRELGYMDAQSVAISYCFTQLCNSCEHRLFRRGYRSHEEGSDDARFLRRTATGDRRFH